MKTRNTPRASNGVRAKLTRPDIMRLALESGLAFETVERCLDGVAVRRATKRMVVVTAERLGLKLPAGFVAEAA